MGPAPLELFRFSLYVFFPIAVMIHYGDPDWYERYVKPFRESYTLSSVPQMEPPKDSSELKEQLARMRQERLAKKAGGSSSLAERQPVTNRQEIATTRGGNELISDLPRRFPRTPSSD